MKKQLFDAKTKKIWQEIKGNYKIILVKNNDYHVNIIEKKFLRHRARISFDLNEIRPDFFAHELLHVYLQHKNFKVSKIIDREFWNYTFLSKCWDRSFRNLINNIIEHSKMIDIYLALGYEQSTFVGDYFEKKCSISEIESEMNIFGVLSLDVLQFTIAKFFLIKGTVNKDISYTEELNLLQSLNPKLFEILNEFWEYCLSNYEPFDIEEQNLKVNHFLSQLEQQYQDIYAKAYLKSF